MGGKGGNAPTSLTNRLDLGLETAVEIPTLLLKTVAEAKTTATMETSGPLTHSGIMFTSACVFRARETGARIHLLLLKACLYPFNFHRSLTLETQASPLIPSV